MKNVSVGTVRAREQIALDNTHRSGNGRRERAIVHVGFIVHIGHHDVSWVTGVRVAFAVHVLMFAC